MADGRFHRYALPIETIKNGLSTRDTEVPWIKDEQERPASNLSTARKQQGKK